MKRFIAAGTVLVASWVSAWGDEPLVHHPEPRDIKMATPPAEARLPIEEIVTVQGVVRTESDSQGNLNAIFIEGDDGQEYRVMLTPETKPIAALNGKKVEMVALLENKGGIAWLGLRSFKPLSP